jgi:ATP-dependent helicase HrpB
MPLPLLPIDPLLPAVCDALRSRTGLVLEAPPGAGKTTRVPRALLDAGFAASGEILVLEPRRLAARLAARRVAEELGEDVGGTVGYQMRFEDVSSARTRVRFVTEGTLTRRMLRDRELRGVAVVLLDEFHERHLDGDLCLALLRRLQLGARPDLRVAAMSATLDAAPIAAFLGDAPRLRSEGRLFDVAVEQLERSDDRPLESQVASAVRRLVAEGLDGDVLVFLPGALEIRRAAEACAKIAHEAGLLLVPLHGSLPPAEQDRAVRPADRRKVILSTNVAETSVTIDGVVAVVDSGLARVALHSPWSGLPTLRLAKVSRASATQRAGRAGRTRPGKCLRLYTRGDFLARAEHEAPEVARADLADALLALAAAGADPATFAWFEAPPDAAIAAARTLLARLGALEGSALTKAGERLLRFPVHPRLGRMLVEGELRGIARDMCAIAALLGERDLVSGKGPRDARHRSDVLSALDNLDEAEAAGFAPEKMRWMGLDPVRASAVDRVRKQLVRMVDTRAPAPGSPEAWEEAALIAVLAGFPDRVGRLRRPAHATGRSAREVVFAGGGTAALSESSGVADVDLVVAVDVEERVEGFGGPRPAGPRPAIENAAGGRPRTVVRMASAVEADWLLELFTDAIRDETEAVWNQASERVEVVRRLRYDGLVLEETRVAKADPAIVARVLAEAVRAKGWRAFARGDDLDQWLLRVAFVRAHRPDAGLPAMDEVGILAILAELCEGAESFADLREHDLADKLRQRLGREGAKALAELAPETITLPGGRRLRVTYAEGARRARSRACKTSSECGRARASPAGACRSCCTCARRTTAPCRSRPISRASGRSTTRRSRRSSAGGTRSTRGRTIRSARRRPRRADSPISPS